MGAVGGPGPGSGPVRDHDDFSAVNNVPKPPPRKTSAGGAHHGGAVVPQNDPWEELLRNLKAVNGSTDSLGECRCSKT